MACTHAQLLDLARTDPVAAADLMVALCVECDRLRAIIDPPPEPEPELVQAPLAGCIVPDAGWTAVADFQKNTTPLAMIRAFPAGRTLTASLSQVDGAIQRHPGAGVMWSTFMAGRSFTDAQVADFAKAIRARADQLPWLDIAVDAEPDRKDRRYNAAQFLAGLRRLKAAVGPHPKIRWVLNLTGYQFLSRIPTWAEAAEECDVLAVDPYWRQDMKPSTVQGGRQDTIDAREWADARGLAFTWGEWGSEIGSNQITNLHHAFDLIEEVRPEYLPYFHDVGTSAHGCWLSGEAWAVYRQRLAALSGADADKAT